MAEPRALRGDAMSAIAKALELAAQGYPVFPVAVSKRPTCPCGFKDAALEPREIRRLWRYHPAPLIGVPTGEASGLFVLDIDSPKHVEAAEWFERYAPYLPETRQQTTRSGGTHLFFNHHQGLRNSAGRIARGIDTRADGGYIIAWQMQAWLIRPRPLADIPAWLIKAATRSFAIGRWRQAQGRRHRWHGSHGPGRSAQLCRILGCLQARRTRQAADPRRT